MSEVTPRISLVSFESHLKECGVPPPVTEFQTCRTDMGESKVPSHKKSFRGHVLAPPEDLPELLLAPPPAQCAVPAHCKRACNLS